MNYTRRTLSWLAAGCLVAATCMLVPVWGDGSATPSPAPTASATGPASPTGPWLVGDLGKIDTVRLATDLVRLRGLKFKQTVPVAAESREQLHEMLQDSVQQFRADPRSGDEARAESATLSSFGFAPPDFQLQESHAAMAEDTIAGFYDPRIKKFFLISDNIRPPVGLDAVIFQKVGFSTELQVATHELDHALQDQYFDLTKVHETMTSSDGDRSLAIKSLIEGEANWIMYAALFDRLGQPPTAMPDLTRLYENAEANRPLYRSGRFPLILRRTTFFPYIEGVEFVHELRRLGLGWDFVNKAWADPPDSTQQILHPFLYVGNRRFPTQVRWKSPGKTMGDWQQADEDTLGEFASWVLFDTLAGETPAHKGLATGWVGDRYRSFVNGDRSAVVWYSTWKDEATANEVEKLLDSSWNGSRFKDLPYHVERQGTDVLAVRGLTMDEFTADSADLRAVDKQIVTHPVLVHLSDDEIYQREAEASKAKMDSKKLAALMPPPPAVNDFVQKNGRYGSSSLAFSLSTAGWNFTSKDTAQGQLLLGKLTNQAPLVVLIHQAQSLGSNDPGLVAEATISEFQSVMDRVQRLGSRALQVHGLPAVLVEFSGFYRPSQVNAHVQVYVVTTPKGQVRVTALGAAEQWASLQGSVQQLLDSISSP